MVDRPDPKIFDRAFKPCPTLAESAFSEVVKLCPDCGIFNLHCCACKNRGLPSLTCHHYRVIFTDGACLNNGFPGAKAGVAAARGTSPEQDQVSAGINDFVDDFPLRSSQRAELVAAQLGIQSFVKKDDTDGDNTIVWIIATDSEYVVKGMTQWLPMWKKNNWLTSNGTPPINMDLFKRLDELVIKHEEDDTQIVFWHISREHNTLADRLAKEAAKQGSVARSEEERESSR